MDVTIVSIQDQLTRLKQVAIDVCICRITLIILLEQQRACLNKKNWQLKRTLMKICDHVLIKCDHR